MGFSVLDTTRKCDCGFLDSILGITSEIEFDAKLGEYSLNNENGQVLFFRYCPACGGKILSRRSSLDCPTSEDEYARIANLLTGVTSFSEAIRRLGQPDRVFFNDDSNSPRQIDYVRLSYTLNISFVLNKNNEFYSLISPKITER